MSLMPRTPDRWVLAALALRLYQHFQTGWHALPIANRRRWLTVVCAGAAGMFGFMVALVSFGKIVEARSLLRWESGFVRMIEMRGPFGFSSAIWFQTFGTDITLAILVLFSIGICAWKARPLSAFSILLAYIGVDLVVRFGWAMWDRSRPDLIAQGVAAPAFHSFPSGHTGKTVAIYGFLASLWWRASNKTTERVFILAITAGITVIVPLARMRMGVHWPSDLLGGYVTGLFWLMILLWAARQETAASRR
ncbi:MAG: phosphatase PAP2 family protein [Longimicrobiales bacterium]